MLDKLFFRNRYFISGSKWSKTSLKLSFWKVIWSWLETNQGLNPHFQKIPVKLKYKKNPQISYHFQLKSQHSSYSYVILVGQALRLIYFITSVSMGYLTIIVVHKLIIFYKCCWVKLLCILQCYYYCTIFIKNLITLKRMQNLHIKVAYYNFSHYFYSNT